MKVLFIAGFGPITGDDASKKSYADDLELPFEEEVPGYLSTNAIDGVKHFSLWPLSQAADSCFGSDT